MFFVEFFYVNKILPNLLYNCLFWSRALNERKEHQNKYRDI